MDLFRRVNAIEEQFCCATAVLDPRHCLPSNDGLESVYDAWTSIRFPTNNATMLQLKKHCGSERPGVHRPKLYDKLAPASKRSLIVPNATVSII